MKLPYPDRKAAGDVLAEHLRPEVSAERTIVLALPRGGVPVAAEVADRLGAPLDLMLVRKLGVPGHEELAMGAIASGGTRVINHDVVSALHIAPEIIDQVADRERLELERRQQAYRGERSAPDVRDRCVVLVDDGLATGATMRAAVTAMRQQGAARIIVAVPVAPPETAQEFRDSSEVDSIVCPATPALFGGVGRWYDDFDQTTDAEVREILARTWRSEAAETSSGVRDSARD